MKLIPSKRVPGLSGALCGCFALAAVFLAGDARGEQSRTEKPVVAIIADQSDRVRMLDDLVFAELGKSQRVNLVEREELRKILEEQELHLSFGAKGGEYRRRLGALLRADFLLLLRINGPNESPALETLIAETRFGYRLVKEVQKWDLEQVETKAGEIGVLLDGALDRFSGGVRLAIAVPPFFSRNLTHRFDHLQQVYAEITGIEAVRWPGVAVVEIEEARAVSEELAVSDGKEKVDRPLPHYIIGEFRHGTLQDDSPVTITMRLQHGAASLSESSAADLDSGAAADFVRKTANGFLDRLSNGEETKLPAADPAREVKTLLRRAQGFLEVGATEESAALYETALLLEPNNIEGLDGAVESYVRICRLSPSLRRPADQQRTPEEQSGDSRQREHRIAKHLTRLVQLKKYDSFYTMRNRVQSAAELLGETKGDFLLYGLPHTWRDKGWRDRDVRREYTDSWFHLIDLIGVPPSRGLADPEWFDYRLKLFQAAYKGKTRWYARWVLLPKGCYDGSLARSYGDEAVQKYIKLHEAFVERFKQVCDDPQGLQWSLEYARLQREFGYRKRQPDLVVLSELTWLWCECRSAGIWEGERALEDLLNESASRHYASIPRFDLPSQGPYRRTLPETGPVIRVGRMVFEPLQLHFTGIDAKVPNAREGSRSQSGAYVVVEGVVPCSPGIDVLWGPASIAVMKEKGRAVEIFRDIKAEISDTCWDGKWFWAATRTGRLIVADPMEGGVRVIDQAEGLPGSGAGMVVCPLETGRICVVGAIPPYERAWCAVVTADGDVNVFHEARRIGEKEDDAGADCAFKPCWVFPIKSPDGKTGERLMVCRDGPRLRHTSERLYPNRYALACHPLLIDPQRLTVEVVEAEMPLGIQELRRTDVVQVGELLFFGPLAVKIDDMNYQIAASNPSVGRLCYPRPSRCGVLHDGMLYIQSDFGGRWIEVNPATVVGEILAEGLALPKWSDYTYFPSHHYGMFALSRFTDGTHYQVSIEAQAMDKKE